MVAKGIMNKGKVYIVREGFESIDSVWDNSQDALIRKDKIQKEGYLADIVVRKVR